VDTERPAPTEPHAPSRSAKWILAAVLVVVLTPLVLGLVLLAAESSDEGPIPGNEVVGSGTVTTETRALTGFEGVSIKSAGRLVLTQGSEESLTVEADDNLMAYIRTEVRGGTLEISAEKDGESYDLGPSQQIVYRIGVIDLAEIGVFGAADIEMIALNTDRLNLDLMGAADVEIANLTADQLSVSVPGYANLTLSGTVTSQDLTWLGAGDYDGRDLRSETVEIDVLGSSSLKVWATGSLDVSIAGSGSIEYYGRPTITQTVTGSGSIKSLGDK